MDNGRRIIGVKEVTHDQLPRHHHDRAVVPDIDPSPIGAVIDPAGPKRLSHRRKQSVRIGIVRCLRFVALPGQRPATRLHGKAVGPGADNENLPIPAKRKDPAVILQ